MYALCRSAGLPLDGRVDEFRELDDASRAFAAWLQKTTDLQRGDRVALMMPNLLQYPVALFGVLRAGMVVVNVNPLYTPRELEHQLKDAGARAIVVLENFAHTLEQVVGATQVRTVVTTQVGDLLPPLQRLLTNSVVKHVKKLVPAWQLRGAVSFRQVLSAGRSQTLDEVALGHDDLAFLQYTGGTTGVAKGAMLSHGNMVANVLQVGAWMSPNLNDGEETLILPLPMYHVFALTGALSFFSKGAQTVLIANPRDMPAFLKVLAGHAFHRDHWRQHAVPVVAGRAGVCCGRPAPAETRRGRRDGGATCGGAPLEGSVRACHWSKATA